MADKEARNNISKDKSLEIAISQIEKEFGKGSTCVSATPGPR